MWSTGVATLGGRIQVGDFTTLDIFKCCTRAVESEVHTDARVSRQEGRKYGQFEDRERERGKEARGEGSRTELVREKRHVRDAAALNSSVALSLNI